jgi:hypothetical protein
LNLKYPGFKFCDILVSKFSFKFNLCRYSVADWVDIGEMVTAACFTSDGTCAVAGSYKGKCHFYSMDGVRFDYLTQLEVRNSRSSKLSG